MTSQLMSIINPNNSFYPKGQLTTWFTPLPVLHSIGCFDLLHLPLTALFCSRKSTGDAILKAYDLACELREKETPVISGFHTPVEKDMLEILLKGKGPIVICPARGLEGMRLANALSKGIEQNRLLLLSIFPGNISRITRETAHQRNLFVACIANERLFIHVDPGGETRKVAEMFTNQTSGENSYDHKKH